MTGHANVQRDDEGYLVNPEEWSRDLALNLAGEEGLVLKEEHWVAIEFVRDYFV